MLHDKMMKLIEKKKAKGEHMSDNEKQAKSSVLKELHDSMAGHLMDKVKGLKKVSVMSDSPEGLKEGLDKAKEIASSLPEESAEMEESPEHEASESAEEESAEHEEKSPEEMSEEELQAKIAELQKCLEEKKQA